MQTFTRELQKILDLVMSLLMDGVARIASPFIMVSDDDTASTDGKAIIKMPATFLGKAISEQMECAIGLLAHEIGHWLQPLDEILEVEKRTGLNHGIVNVLLDIQLEENVVRIMPLFKYNLAEVRSAVGSSNKKNYTKGMSNAETFLDAALYTLLYGRFCGDVKNHSFTSYVVQARTSLLHKFPRLAPLAIDAAELTICASSGLPAAIEVIAKRYPELCDNKNGNGRKLLNPDGGGQVSGTNANLNPTDAVSSSNIESLARLINSSIAAYNEQDDCHEEIGKPSGSTQPSAEVLAVSRSIQRRWEVPKSAGTIMGPGRMDRLAAVRGDPVPFLVNSPQGRSHPKVKVLLAADHTGSMNGDRWRETLKAAQAITLAIRNTGGEVLGAIFERSLIHEKDFNADIFFASEIGSRSLMCADGNTTSFGWLPLVWQMFPKHRIVLLTDGNGLRPPVVPLASRKRTSAILLQVNTGTRINIEATVQAFAERFVHVDDLSEIASAWSVAIPRLAQ